MRGTVYTQTTSLLVVARLFCPRGHLITAGSAPSQLDQSNVELAICYWRKFNPEHCPICGDSIADQSCVVSRELPQHVLASLAEHMLNRLVMTALGLTFNQYVRLARRALPEAWPDVIGANDNDAQSHTAT